MKKPVGDSVWDYYKGAYLAQAMAAKAAQDAAAAATPQYAYAVLAEKGEAA